MSIELVEVGRGDNVAMLPLKSRSGADPLGLFAGKLRLILLGGTEAINEGDTEGLD